MSENEPVFKPMTWDDIMAAGPETADQAYRRGYRDGFIAALYATCPKVIPKKLWNFWLFTLLDWVNTDNDKLVFPPRVK